MQIHWVNYFETNKTQRRAKINLPAIYNNISTYRVSLSFGKLHVQFCNHDSVTVVIANFELPVYDRINCILFEIVDGMRYRFNVMLSRVNIYSVKNVAILAADALAGFLHSQATNQLLSTM